ncbi:MAG: hypothetical protein EOP10_19135 [Proteobacteria bacterium]|nr:MAG: hypothetical protein EOP10_19135 [Pseudomonadota bacterium]
MTDLETAIRSRKISIVVGIDDENALPRLDGVEEAARILARQKHRKIQHLVHKQPKFESVLKVYEEVSQEDVDDRASALERELSRLAHEGTLLAPDLRAASEIIFQGHTGITAKSIRAALGESVEFKSMSFGDWLNQREQILHAASSENRVLILVDEFNEFEREVDCDGARLLASLWGEASDVSLFDAIVVTANCSPDGEFSESKDMLSRVRDLVSAEQRDQVRRAFVISKERLNTDLSVAQRRDSFIVQLNRLEAADLRKSLIDDVEIILAKSLKNAVRWLDDLPLPDFHGSVFLSSEVEGAAELDTLLRLTSLQQRNDVEKSLKSNSDLRDRIAAVREFAKRNLDSDFEAAAKIELTTLRRLEFERPGEELSALLMPLACGDIFELQSECKVEASSATLDRRSESTVSSRRANSRIHLDQMSVIPTWQERCRVVL